MSSFNLLFVEPTMGAILIGVIAAAILYGATCAQISFYFYRYRKVDKLGFQILVSAIWLCDTIHQVLICHTVYYYVVKNYNNPLSLDLLVWSILLEVLFNGLIGLFVQSFLLFRLHRLSGRNIYLFILAGGFIVAEFGIVIRYLVSNTLKVISLQVCSLIFTILSMQMPTWAELHKLKGLSMTVNVLAAAGDILIASSSCIFLQTARTGVKKSDSMITRLIAFSVSTGLLTSMCAIASLISIVVGKDTLIYVAFYFSLGRLYTNSILAALNARQAIRRIGEAVEKDEFSSRISICLKRHDVSSDSMIS